MAERDSQYITVSRQGILIATAVGVGLLTFCYVLGVQVGKRSLTQKSSRAFSIDEELKKLPVPLDQQIDLFKSIDSIGDEKRPERTKQPAAAQTSTATDAPRREPEPEPTRQAPPPTQQTEPAKQPVVVAPTTQATPPRSAAPQNSQSERWTAQVAALSDAGSANRLAETLKQQGMPAKVVFENGFHKVQLDWSGTSAELDSRISKLQILGHRPIRVRLQ
ncbi:MAG: SPOR domain-containing protein [Holophagales bacterium]|nr:SPOR domain-containing protein [Holophagales bacterium]